METIPLTEDLCIKKLDPTDSKDVWLINQLNQDSLVTKYLDTFNYIFADLSYLESDSLYDAPYSILKQGDPIGYLEISQLFVLKRFVDLSYAIHKNARGNKYAEKTIRAISNILLDELNGVKLLIDKGNIASQCVAQKCGFINQISKMKC